MRWGRGGSRRDGSQLRARGASHTRQASERAGLSQGPGHGSWPRRAGCARLVCAWQQTSPVSRCLNAAKLTNHPESVLQLWAATSGQGLRGPSSFCVWLRHSARHSRGFHRLKATPGHSARSLPCRSGEVAGPRPRDGLHVPGRDQRAEREDVGGRRRWRGRATVPHVLSPSFLIVLIYGFGFRTNPAFHRGCSLITGAGAWPSFNLHLEEKNHFIYFTFSTYLFLFFVTLLNLWPLFLRFFIAH